MKSNLDLINDCDRLPCTAETAANYYSFRLDGYSCAFGYMLHDAVLRFSWSADWSIDHARRTVTLHGRTQENRDEHMKATLLAEKEKGTFTMLQKWTGEEFAVYGPGGEIVLSMERSGTLLFGVVTYGIQMLVYQKVNEKFSIWISRRARTKRTFPGMLDSTVGGSMRTGEGPRQCLLREAEEEASFAPSMTSSLAISCGVLSYVYIVDDPSGGENGFVCPEVQFLYEMQLPNDVIPSPGDNEVETFELMTMDEIKEKLGAEEFTPANACVVLDFFIRHGIMTPENEENYVEITSRLRRRQIFPTLCRQEERKRS